MIRTCTVTKPVKFLNPLKFAVSIVFQHQMFPGIALNQMGDARHFQTASCFDVKIIGVADGDTVDQVY